MRALRAQRAHKAGSGCIKSDNGCIEGGHGVYLNRTVGIGSAASVEGCIVWDIEGTQWMHSVRIERTQQVQRGHTKGA